YRTEFDNGLTEYEFDHVFTGQYDHDIHPDNAEVSDYCYKSTEAIAADLASHPHRFTSWFHLAFPLLLERMGAAPLPHSQRLS
ncbi:MAG TPA: hypothetical protein VNU70_02490, partial [Puia sp.]|nr:hypothetical protein [Puia sp.]